MSFYLTANSSKFVCQNDAVNLGKKVQFLRSGFQQPFSNTPQTDILADDHTYTTAELLNRYIVRTSVTGSYPSDTLPTAVEMINAIKAQQDVRRLAQDSTNVAPYKGFFWDVCFSVPTNDESINELTIRSPNDAFVLDPSVDGVVTITNSVNGNATSNFYVQPSAHIWVRFTLVNLKPESGYLEVNASVLTNNCYFD